MAAGVNTKISAASARSHNSRSKQKNFSSKLPLGILKIILSVFFVGVLAWAYQAIQPPPPKICGSPGGPPITAPRIKLRDGRHLAYKEYGVSKDVAMFKIVFIHGLYCSCKQFVTVAGLSPEIIEELGIYGVSYDRPGYGESDPHPEQTVKSLALEVEELADQLGLGSKFYVIGMSLGGALTWSCLKYIPHRIAGAALLSPVTNFWWPRFPANLSKEAYYQHLPGEQWAYRIAHYTPWLTHWWKKQILFPVSNVLARNPVLLSTQDREVIARFLMDEAFEGYQTQQGEAESIDRDLNVGFGKWEFDPMELENPFPNNEGSVHVWHGDDDNYVPVMLQRYLVQQLPWVHYHELPGSGHFFSFLEGMPDIIVKAMLTPEK